MTAEPTGEVAWAPDPVRQRARAYTLEDLFLLPDDAPRVELADGVLSVVPPPSVGHQKINYRLVAWFERHAPEAFEALFAVGVLVDLKHTLEPDVALVRRPVDNDHHYVEPGRTELVVEIVSPSTRCRDRLVKPGLYAAAGIPHYWRVEQGPMHLFAYDLVHGCYEPVADSTEEIVLSKPFEIRLPIRDITP